MSDVASNMKFVRVFDINSYTNPPTSVAIDRLGFESLTILVGLSTNVLLGGTGTLTLKHGDTNVVANMTNVSADDMIGSLGAVSPTDAGDDFKISYRGNKRYVSLVITEDTAWTAWMVVCYGILSNPQKLPIS